jgi:hypothetical protein
LLEQANLTLEILRFKRRKVHPTRP